MLFLPELRVKFLILWLFSLYQGFLSEINEKLHGNHYVESAQEESSIEYDSDRFAKNARSSLIFWGWKYQPFSVWLRSFYSFWQRRRYSLQLKRLWVEFKLRYLPMSYTLRASKVKCNISYRNRRCKKSPQVYHFLEWYVEFGELLSTKFMLVVWTRKLKYFCMD